MDDKDYTKRYNTAIPSEKESAFAQWAKEINARRGRGDIRSDNYDYDVNGAFLGGVEPTGGHFPDTYKKPNHPTFSNQSQYSAGPTMTGGEWAQTPGPVSLDTFQTSPFNERMWREDELARYFKNAEPNGMMTYGRRGQR